MKVTKYLPILPYALWQQGCNSKKEAVLTSGIDLANLDTTANAGYKFYQYACGGWIESHPLTDEYSRFGSFDMFLTRKAANSWKNWLPNWLQRKTTLRAVLPRKWVIFITSQWIAWSWTKKGCSDQRRNGKIDASRIKEKFIRIRRKPEERNRPYFHHVC